MKGIFVDSFKTSQNYWAYFLALSDGILDKGGKIGAVLPRDFIAGQHSEDVREWLFKNSNYTLRYIVKTVNEIAFSENARFRDFLVVLEKLTGPDKCGVVYLKKPLSEMSIDEAKGIGSKVRESPRGRLYEDDDIFVYWIKQKDIAKNWKNLWPYVAISQPRNIKPITNFRKSFQKKTHNRVTPLKKAIAKVIRGIEPVSEGLLNVLFVMRPINSKRLGRSVLILERESRSNITAGIKETGTTLTIPRRNVLPGLKTHAYVNRYDITSICDMIIQEDFDGFEKIRRLTVSKKIDFFNVKKQISKRTSRLFLSRRFNFAAPGTKVLSFYSDLEMAPGKAFWSLATDIDTSKTYCVWFNSIISIIQMFVSRTESEGAWCELTEETAFGLDVPTHKLISEQKDRFLRIFDNYRNVEWPSLIEQFKGPFLERRNLDEDIFKILGFKQKEINKLLPDLYGAMVDELLTLKRAMGSQKEVSDDSQLEFDMV